MLSCSEPLYADVLGKVSLYALRVFRKRAELEARPCKHIFTTTMCMVCPCKLEENKRAQKIPPKGVLRLKLADFDPIWYLSSVSDMNLRFVNPLAALSLQSSSQYSEPLPICFFIL
jgi:hypothetical protein